MTADVDGSGGRVVAGRYRLLEKLGSGTHGTVWRAFDGVLEVQVAVKELRLDNSAGDADDHLAFTRVEREARIVAKLRDHPHVVTVLDVVSDGGLPWIVMELVESRSLAQLVRATGPLPPERVATIGVAVLAALVAAHGLGITHRDVKPANILIGDGGRVVLADFGVASHDGQPTIAGGPVGTLAYIAPEQFAGVRGKPAGDLFSLGATLYFALTGASPFSRSTEAATIEAVLHHVPTRPAGPDRLVDAVLGLLVKDLAGRITADEAAAAFTAVAAEQAPAAAARAPVAGLTGSSPSGPQAGPGLLGIPGTAATSPGHGAEQVGPTGGPSTEPVTATGPRARPSGLGPAGLARSDRSALDRAVGGFLLAATVVLALAPWPAASLAGLPWWGYSAAAVITVFFGSWAVAFGTVLIRPSALRR
ncbi:MULTISPECIES: serine/threonine-protein kinase [unclassified Pseudofrankia]|uniref:serine/threonine-protein kinase n=1 Tax=unclassified Pseudofrankia TaxID=2994372 RepID=UPI0008DAB39C|nr:MULTISPECIES: serine/threonine-protein kinase [unclassified Pseudofrankia]MDT3441128.1 serine/threonine-protein kinase [Pseudofrankia sp. BMG5.37]OHV54269.1 hypothetical protein BCD48_09385 [Pseudofrankia sp. BMG5.36]